MFQKLNFKSEFSQNVFTVITGTTVAQGIPILISPLLTRIYTPEDFGLFALFLSITAIFGSVSAGKYELAIMLPKKQDEALNIFVIGFVVTFVISISLFILIFLFNDYFSNILGNTKINQWLYFVPLAVFFIGIWNLLNYFNNRVKNYKNIKNANILKSLTLAFLQLSIGFFKME